jgi:hypothetical protein
MRFFTDFLTVPQGGGRFGEIVEKYGEEIQSIFDSQSLQIDGHDNKE